MNRSFHLRLSDNFPWAIIPNRWIWDLAEYLAVRRVQVTYTYSAQQFIVNFPHMELHQVRELLNGWAENQPVPESVAIQGSVLAR